MICLFPWKEFDIPGTKPDQISHLLVLSQCLLQEDAASCWENVCKCILNSLAVDNAAVFKSDECSQPLAGSSLYDCRHLISSDSPCKKDKIWGFAARLGRDYILYVEKKRSFSEEDINFIRLVCNMVALRSEFVLEVYRVENLKEKSTSRRDLRFPYPEIIGESGRLTDVLSTIDKIANTDVPVLIEGESGTGKELIARAVHHYSKRCHAPFVSENCAAIPETLLESELFGYMRGAFTGAFQNKEGLFVVANQGTLFLDEIGDMSFNMQKKLLRALQDGEIRPVGSQHSIKVDVRIVTATNKDLKQALKEGAFREDLYYRLNVVHLVCPPLRERGEDVLLLFEHFLQKKAEQMGISPPKVADEVKQYLLKYPWPGNIRELQNEVQRILAIAEGDIITLDSLSPEILAMSKNLESPRIKEL